MRSGVGGRLLAGSAFAIVDGNSGPTYRLELVELGQIIGPFRGAGGVDLLLHGGADSARNHRHPHRGLSGRILIVDLTVVRAICMHPVVVFIMCCLILTIALEKAELTERLSHPHR